MGVHRDQTWRTQWLPLVLAALGVGGLLGALMLVGDGTNGTDVASGFTTAPTPAVTTLVTPAATPTPEPSAGPTEEPTPTVSASPRSQPPVSRTTPPRRTPVPTTTAPRGLPTPDPLPPSPSQGTPRPPWVIELPTVVLPSCIIGCDDR